MMPAQPTSRLAAPSSASTNSSALRSASSEIAPCDASPCDANRGSGTASAGDVAGLPSSAIIPSSGSSRPFATLPWSTFAEHFNFRRERASAPFTRRHFAQRSLGGGQPCNRHPEGRAGNIVEANLVAEGNGSGIATVLAADPDLELVARLAATLGTDPHQLADPLAVDRHERVALEDATRRVGAEETRRIITADAECGLREIIGAE